MLKVDLNNLNNNNLWFDRNPSAQIASCFPVHSGVGARSTGVVYMDFDPQFFLEEHTDSAEEIVLVLEGKLQGTIGGEQGEVNAGELVVIPAMVPHSFHNASDNRARAVGFFSSSTIISTFVEPLQPINIRVLINPGATDEHPAAEGK